MSTVQRPSWKRTRGPKPIWEASCSHDHVRGSVETTGPPCSWAGAAEESVPVPHSPGPEQAFSDAIDVCVCCLPDHSLLGLVPHAWVWCVSFIFPVVRSAFPFSVHRCPGDCGCSYLHWWEQVADQRMRLRGGRLNYA